MSDMTARPPVLSTFLVAALAASLTLGAIALAH